MRRFRKKVIVFLLVIIMLLTEVVPAGYNLKAAGNVRYTQETQNVQESQEPQNVQESQQESQESQQGHRNPSRVRKLRILMREEKVIQLIPCQRIQRYMRI